MPHSSSSGRTIQVTVIVAVAALTALAWAYLLHLDREMSAAMKYAQDMLDMGMPMNEPWARADVGYAVVMWSVMMIGMMAPSVAPMLFVVAGAAASRAQTGASGGGASGGMTSVFSAGYFVVWVGFSIGAALAQWLLHDAAVLSPTMAAASARAGGVLLIVAGLYQLTPLKRACLVHCRSPLDFLMRHWRNGLGGAFRMGLHHGAYCLGCCWALMLVLFAVGIMNLVWVAAIGVFVLLEKTGRAGLWFSRAAGIALIAFGAVFLIRP